MARCEDFPCCGHEAGCCPDFDPDTGQQLNMVCTCGAKLPLTSRYSICDACMRAGDEDECDHDYNPGFDDDDEVESQYEPEDYGYDENGGRL